MASRTSKVVPQFDFTEALALPLPERFARSVQRGTCPFYKTRAA
jgi:hypothetical protein